MQLVYLIKNNNKLIANWKLCVYGGLGNIEKLLLKFGEDDEFK